jgi:hypothetical protein
MFEFFWSLFAPLTVIWGSDRVSAASTGDNIVWGT